ncbi:hypothetical protein B0J17DRAFT_711015 [Rhizoctonia solani]|nr:hypothetical protein B0J17DRAFT_711015 [Rhizoctonia solani]
MSFNLGNVRICDAEALCKRQCQIELQEAQATIHEIECGLKKLIIREQRALSRFLIPAGSVDQGDSWPSIQWSFEDLWTRKYRKTKKHFRESVARLMEKLDSIPESIGLILPVALGEVACQRTAFLTIWNFDRGDLASLWQIPELGEEDIEKRKEFVREADNILRQTRLWLTKIPTQ